MKEIRQALESLRDEDYAAFQRKLVPNIDPARILGVRTPQLRVYAKQLRGTDTAAAFLRELPHETFDENNLHGCLLGFLTDYDTAIQSLNAFLPYVDNWATCDMLSPRVLGRHLPSLAAQCRVWIASDETYTVRFGLELLMRWFLDDAFSDEYPALAAQVQSDEYYINMMLAWYFATALAKQYAAVVPYLEQQRLAKWVHNKTIQKAVESYRITDAQKAYLRTLRVR